MKLDWLKPVATDPGPHVSVYVDVSRTREKGAHEMEVRWKDAREALAGQGAPEPALQALDDVATTPSEVGGPVGRALIASTGGIEIDVLLPDPPAQDEAVTGPVAPLMPLVRSLADDVRYVLVELDRAGADITVTSSDAPRGSEEVREVTAGHDLLHKIPGGGWAHLRYQHAVQDSWDHNAAAVAEELHAIVRREHPEVVLLTGDVKASAALRSKAAKQVLELLVDVPGGSRHPGVHEESFNNAVAEALEEVRRRRRDAVVDEFEQEAGRGGRAVKGLAPVVDALRRGQVRTVLLRDDPDPGEASEMLWVGATALEIGTTAEEVRALGGDGEPFRVRADAAIVRALAASDAEIELVAERPDLVQGIGAVLRYADASTPA